MEGTRPIFVPDGPHKPFGCATTNQTFAEAVLDTLKAGVLIDMGRGCRLEVRYESDRMRPAGTRVLIELIPQS